MANVPAMLRSSPRATWDARSTISSWRGTNDRIEGMLNGLAMGDSLGYDGAAELAPVLPHGRMDTASKRKQAYPPQEGTYLPHRQWNPPLGLCLHGLSARAWEPPWRRRRDVPHELKSRFYS